MAAAVVPAVQLGISAFGAFKRHKAQKKQQQQQEQLAAEAKAARGAITQQAPQFAQQGKAFGDIGLPLLRDSSNYYRALIGGDRGAIDAALAPERAGIADTYRGAQKSVDFMRGPTKDLAQAELNKQRAGQLGLLPAMARKGAIEGGTQLGLDTARTGLDARRMGASLYESAGQLAHQGAQTGINQGYLNLAQNQQNFDMGQGMGSLFGDVLKGVLGKFGGGGGRLPTTTWNPPMSPYPTAIYGSR